MREYGVSPVTSALVFLGILLVLTIIVERVSIALLRRVTSKTATTLDDVFVEGIPGIVRAICVTLALRVVALAFLPERMQENAASTLHAASVAVVGILAARLILRMVSAWIDVNPALKPLGPGIRLTIKVLIIPVILILVLQAFGVRVEAFLAGLGIGALAVGLALQDVLKNIFAGVQLVMDQPVRAGDYVKLANGIEGTVIEMGLRSTKLLTNEHNTVILPNATLANEVITNTDLIDHTFAHSVIVGVVYGSDTRRVESVLLEEAKAFAANEQGAVKENGATDVVFVRFHSFGDSALNFRVTVRLNRFQGSPGLASELNHRIYERLKREGIEIAFPTRTVYVRNEAFPRA